MTMKPGEYELRIYQGKTFYFPFAIEDPDGLTLDPTTEGDGYTVGRMQVRDMAASDGGEVILELTTDNGGVVLGAFTDESGDWSGYLFASAAATAALVPWGEGQYDLEIATSTGIRAAAAFCTISTLQRLVMTAKPFDGSTPFHAMAPISLSSALCRPTSSRVS